VGESAVGALAYPLLEHRHAGEEQKRRFVVSINDDGENLVLSDKPASCRNRTALAC
jgi:hypothetical protein